MRAPRESRYGDCLLELQVKVRLRNGATEAWGTEVRFFADEPAEEIGRAIKQAFTNLHIKARELVR